MSSRGGGRPQNRGALVALAVSAAVPEEEVQLWKQALKEDPKYKEIVQQLRN